MSQSGQAVSEYVMILIFVAIGLTAVDAMQGGSLQDSFREFIASKFLIIFTLLRLPF